MGLVVLLSVGMPMPLVAVLATTGIRKIKTEGAQGIASTAKVPADPSRSSQKIIDGKMNRLRLLLSLKKHDRLS